MVSTTLSQSNNIPSGCLYVERRINPFTGFLVNFLSGSQSFLLGLNTRTFEIFEECLSYENEYLLKNGANVYDGVEDVFKELNKKYNVFIVSNCQEGYLRTFLEYYDFNKYVLDYEEAGRTGMPKDENIRLVIKRNHLDKAFYVGDTLGDMESTDKAGIPFIHAAYGFGTVPADRMKINNIKELPEFIDDLLSKDTDN